MKIKRENEEEEERHNFNNTNDEKRTNTALLFKRTRIWTHRWIYERFVSYEPLCFTCVIFVNENERGEKIWKRRDFPQLNFPFENPLSSLFLPFLVSLWCFSFLWRRNNICKHRRWRWGFVAQTRFTKKGAKKRERCVVSCSLREQGDFLRHNTRVHDASYDDEYE